MQLRRTDETVYERFESYEALKRQGKEPNIDHYDVVYVAPLSSYTDQTAMLEGLYTKFNVERPEDFRGHSLSVSDIVALKTDAVVSFHYVDLTIDEKMLILLYSPGTRMGLYGALQQMKEQLEEDETELLDLTNSVLQKLSDMDDEVFEKLSLSLDL